MAQDAKIETKGRKFNVIGTRPIRPDGIDKVTGRARFGADMNMPGQLTGKVLRSPHAHAMIKSIDTSAAEALPGVKAVITSKDLPDMSGGDQAIKDNLINTLARDRVLYDGHAIAAVAAVSNSVALKALKLIKVVYEILPHVTDVEAAMKPGAPLVNGGAITSGMTPAPAAKSNIIARHEFGHGDIVKGFKDAHIVVERNFTTEATHQGYIEPHACVASINADGFGDVWVCTQGHYNVRATCAALLGLDMAKLRVTASEIGGGFGGKTVTNIEPLALALSRKANRPVKMVMSREEVFRGTGPTASSSIWTKIGATKDGRITAAHAVIKFQGGPFGGSLVDMGAMAAFACYDLPNVKTEGYDVLCNRPRLAAYRAPSAPMVTFATESVVQEIADKLGLDSADIRIKNAAKEGTKSSYGPTYGPIGIRATLEAAKNHPHYSAPIAPGKHRGRGMACGFWFNFGGNTSVSMGLNADGTVALSYGNPDIGGTRASLSMMAAEELGIPYEKVRCVIADTATLGHNDITDGSRVTFAAGLATIEAARDAIKKMCARAAKTWGIAEDAVVWEKGHAKPAGSNAGKFEALSLKQIVAASGNTGGPIAGHYEVFADGAGVSFGTHIADVEVDVETGKVTVLRYTVFQDAGKAIHPAYVEGQYQGGAAQGIGWALNEEYIYGKDGRLQNAGFLDYRIPVCSDLPMIEAVILEIPNPGHPYGVRGVGETPIVPPLGAMANAIAAATGVRMGAIPMSPPRLLKAIEEMGKG